MSATKCAIPLESWPDKPAAEARSILAGPQPVVQPLRVPALRVTPLLRTMQPRRFVRVPTHAVGVHPEHREYPRAALKLPLRLRSVRGVPEGFPISLVTRNISSTGVYFLCPKQLTVATSIELEIVLEVSRWASEMSSWPRWLGYAGWKSPPCPAGTALPRSLKMCSLTATMVSLPVF